MINKPCISSFTENSSKNHRHIKFLFIHAQRPNIIYMTIQYYYHVNLINEYIARCHKKTPSFANKLI